MFWTLIYPSSGACDCVDELPHQSSCSQFVVCWSFCCGWYLVVFVLQAEACYILFHILCAQYVSDINISIFRSLRLCWWITTSVVLFSVRCVLELLLRLVFGCVRFAGWNTVVLQPAKRTQPNISRNKSSNTQWTENKTTDVVIHQHSRRLLKMAILMPETCWAHKKWNKIASDIKLVFHSSDVSLCLPQLVSV